MRVRLNDRDAECLAKLLPLLACGEASASWAFAQLRDLPQLSAAQAELARATRRFFVRLGA